MGMFEKAMVAVSWLAFSVVNSFAITNQFRGVNWADKRDNFVSDVLLLSGMSLNDTYESASLLAEHVVGQFVEKLHTNSVRIPINEPTASKFWATYKGIIDMSLSKGRVVIGYWGPAQPSGPKNMDDWWKMWDAVVKDYGVDENAYFEVFNEPHMYKRDELRNLYAQWLERYPDVPRNHIILDGTGMAQNVPDIAGDSRLDGSLIAVHEYTFWNMSINTEQGWKNSFKGKVGDFADRTVCTEWGGAMSPGDKAGVHYDYMDYNSTPTNYFMAYIRGISDQLREWQMGSFYWPGLRDGDWYSMTKRSGEGANVKLEIVNQSGVDRMWHSWSDTVEVVLHPQEPFGGFDAAGAVVAGTPTSLPGKLEAENYDLGGPRKAYFDKNSENQGKVYRNDGVDIVGLDCSDSLNTKDCQGYGVGYTQVGEWLAYTINVTQPGALTARARVASGLDGSSFMLFIDGEAASDTVKIPKGDDWSTYGNVDFEVSGISAGEHVLKLLITGAYANVDWIEFYEDDAESNLGKFVFTNDNLQVYRIFDLNGVLLGSLRSSSSEVAARIREFVKFKGVLMAKPAFGKTVKVQVK